MEKKKQRIYAVIALVTLALLVVGATYAYFQNQYGDSSQTDVKVTTYTTDLLTFETGDAINITADQDTFAKGKGNQTGSSFAKAILQANSKTNVATANYYIYLKIESNEFTYTDSTKAELVLQVTDNSGNPVTSIDGLTYVTVVDGNGTSISGFDITDKSGLIALVNNKEISASPKAEEQYNISLVLVNYDFDQNNNAGKSFNAKLMIQKYKFAESLADVASSGDNLADSIKLLSQKSVSSISNLYYHDSNLKNGAGDNSYRYAGASESVNNYVCFGSDDATCPVDNLYRIIGVFDGRVKLIKADAATSSLLGTDGDYNAAYSFSTPNYKGSLSISDIGGYYFNYNGLEDKTINDGYGSNTWSTSLLNKTNLNTNYLNNIGSKWANMIDTTTWKVGGNTYYNIYNSISSVVFQNEIVNPATSTTYEAKVGLMYASDYGFAAGPSAWTKKLTYDSSGSDNHYSNSSVTSINWMYMGLYEWTISPNSSYLFSVFSVYNNGNLGSSANNGYSVRPVSYLDASVKYNQGSGTKNDPVRITY